MWVSWSTVERWVGREWHPGRANVAALNGTIIQPTIRRFEESAGPGGCRERDAFSDSCHEER